MNGNIAVPRTSSVTYRPGQDLPENPEKRELIASGETLANKAQNVKDFFLKADNGELDKDPREGAVILTNAPAPGLVEQGTDSVWGTYQGGTVTAHGYSSRHPHARSTIVVEENNVFTEADSHINNRFMPTMESLTKNDDGTVTYSQAYLFHRNS